MRSARYGLTASRMFVVATLMLLVQLAPRSEVTAADDLREGETVEDVWGVEVFDGYPTKEQLAEAMWSVRIVDDVTGQPIPGARVAVPYHPDWGIPDAETHMLAEATADFEGWASIPYAAIEGWDDYGFADAPGYAATEECTPGEVECRLRRGVEVPVVLVDYLGRPVPHARIALNLACGHVPDQRTATTDAKGRAVLRSIDPSRHRDIWIEALGCHRGTARLRRTWREGDPPVAIDAVPGTSVSGRIVTADGSPVAHALVGSADRHRPWTRTDLEGRFHLVGTSRWDSISYQVSSLLGAESGAFTAPPEGTERIVTLGRVEALREVAIQVRGDQDEPADLVRVALVRRADGYTATELTDDEGRLELEVPEGGYDVVVDGELGVWGRSTSTLEVSAAAGDALALRVPRNPTVTVDASRVEEMRVGLTTATGFRALDMLEGQDRRKLVVPVPSEGLARFRVSTHEGGELVVAFHDVPAPGGSVVLDGPPVTHVRGTVFAPNGSPTQGVLFVQRRRYLDTEEALARPAELVEANHAPSFETRLVGTVAWILQPLDPELAWAHGDIELPEGGGDVELGAIRLVHRATTALQLDVPPELGFSEACLVFRVPGLEGSLIGWAGSDGRLDTDDTKEWPALGAGTRLEIAAVKPTVAPTLSLVLEGPPPWHVAWPRQRMDVEVRAVEGDQPPLEHAAVFVDGELLGAAWSDGQPMRVHGLTTGWHLVTVVARGRQAKRYRLLVREDELRHLVVHLARATD